MNSCSCAACWHRLWLSFLSVSFLNTLHPFRKKCLPLKVHQQILGISLSGFTLKSPVSSTSHACSGLRIMNKCRLIINHVAAVEGAEEIRILMKWSGLTFYSMCRTDHVTNSNEFSDCPHCSVQNDVLVQDISLQLRKIHSCPKRMFSLCFRVTVSWAAKINFITSTKTLAQSSQRGLQRAGNTTVCVFLFIFRRKELLFLLSDVPDGGNEWQLHEHEQRDCR